MLSGVPPFTGGSENEILLNTMLEELEFENEVWETISPEAIDLITSMLVKKYTNRITAKEIYENP